jgi:hypothetical protein
MCGVWANYTAESEETLKKDRAAANKAVKDAREAKKAAAGADAAVAADATAAAAAPAAAEVAGEAADEAVAHDGATSFHTYVENLLKAIKKDEHYQHMRVSNRVREYLSELLSQGLARLASLALIIVQQVMGVRTMNASHMKAVVHMLMHDSGRSDAQVGEVTSAIDTRLAMYQGHLKSEKEKKAGGLDEAQKAGLAHKKLEAELASKKKKTEGVKKRALDAAHKAKELTKETSDLEALLAATQKPIVAAQ